MNEKRESRATKTNVTKLRIIYDFVVVLKHNLTPTPPHDPSEVTVMTYFVSRHPVTGYAEERG